MDLSTSWPIFDASDLASFQALVHPLSQMGHGAHRQWAFRGQGNHEWSLRPTLARELGRYESQGRKLPSSWSTFDNSLLNTFKQKAHLYQRLDSITRKESKLDWMVLGRHFGLPTRLLDWSLSAYVAAWTAATEEPDEDGVVWSVSLQHVNSGWDSAALIWGTSENLEEIVQGLEPEGAPLLFFVPVTHNSRSALQQGIFSIAGDGMADHASLITDAASKWTIEPKCKHFRIRIPAKAKRDFVRSLRFMNVTAETLFGDLDGLCRELLQILRDHPEELAHRHEEAVLFANDKIREMGGFPFPKPEREGSKEDPK